MVSSPSSTQQQGHYRYNPVGIPNGGPARIFPYVGEDGILRYVASEFRRNLVKQGQLSEPWTLLLEQVDSTLLFLDEAWVQIGTKLADWNIFQSGLLNFNLPPDEQFSSDYMQHRKAMVDVLLAARKAAQSEKDSSANSVELSRRQRQRFYEAIEKQQRQRPQVSLIHEKEGGLSDREFARQRLAGSNPMILRRVQEPERTLLQDWEAPQRYTLANGETVDLQGLATQNRLFIADYPLLKNLTTANLQPGRYVGSPKALFYRSQQGLEPLLIQLEAGGKIFTPTRDADEWMRAKLYVQVADATHHELIDHLCHTHFAMEVFAIATPRQLPATHPVYQLLAPHFRFLLAINMRGNTVLLGEGSATARLLAPTSATSLDLINQGYRQRSFEDYSLPKDIKRRGLSQEFLPEFPYRDDATLLWEAIARYVSAYLTRYYRDDQAVQQDPYLQAWAAELGAPLDSRSPAEFPQAPAWLPRELTAPAGLKIDSLPHHPRVPDFPPSEMKSQQLGELTTLQQLIDIATQIIFTCGPQHAAVNFSQFDYLGHVPNNPLAAYAKPNDASSLEQILPPLEQDLGQMELTFALSGVNWGQLGSSDLIQFADPGDRKILKQFQTELQSIEGTIKSRNQQRLAKSGVAYPYLLPSQIPNSINI
ncbi:MAG: hypothetical protein KME06_01335 [Kastovskya adunca ATA6-11-RM4]|jgi:arachidonate 15-lipoxygenase|nr:hypothetical protein [Kastovskya adunca ATA6-11-RM4]